jgi:hypothetical protein
MAAERIDSDHLLRFRRQAVEAIAEVEPEQARNTLAPAEPGLFGPQEAAMMAAAIFDEALLAAIRADLARSPWTGEGTAKCGAGCG